MDVKNERKKKHDLLLIETRAIFCNRIVGTTTAIETKFHLPILRVRLKTAKAEISKTTNENNETKNKTKQKNVVIKKDYKSEY